MAPGQSGGQAFRITALAAAGAARRNLGRNWFKAWSLTALGWTLTCAYLLLQTLAGLAQPLGIFDDCIPLVSAELINHGHKPIVDFYYIYPPSLDYVYSIAFRLVGGTVLVPRLFSSLLYITVAIRASRFLKRQVPALAHLGFVATLLAAVSLFGISRLASWPSYAFGLLAIFSYPADEYLDSSATKRQLMVCGLLAGASLLVRLNFGIYVATVLCAYTGLRVQSSDFSKSRKRSLAVTLLVVLIGSATLPSVIFYGWVYGSGAWTAVATMVASMQAALPMRFIVLNPVDTARLLLYPFFWWMASVIVDTKRLGIDSLVVLMGGAGLVLIATAARASMLVPLLIPALTMCMFTALSLWRSRLGSIHLLFVLFYAAVLHYYLSRADFAHAAPLWALEGLMFIPLLIPVSSATGVNPSRMGQRGATLAALLAGICLYGNNAESIPPRSYVTNGAAILANWARHPKISDSARIQGRLSVAWQSIFSSEGEFDAGEWDAVKYITSHTRSSDRIFVGTTDNSRIFLSDVRIYWLTGRLPGARYYELDPGVASTDAAQQRIILDLQQNAVNWVILQDEHGFGDATFLAKVHAESRRLDDFLRSEFGVTERFGRFSILIRRNAF